MKKLSDNEKLLLITAGLAACILISRTKAWSGTNGVGKVKFYKALSEAQRAGIQFGGKGTSLTKDEESILNSIGVRNGYKQSKASAAHKSYAEAFYNYLNAKYNAVTGVGKIYYPYDEYQIVNDKGDVVVIFHDYDEEKDLLRAIDLLCPEYCRTAQDAYWRTLQYIADGGKFCWASKKSSDGTILSAGVADELFGSGSRGREKRDLSEQRKAYRGILSANGAYPATFADEITAYGEDSGEVRNGVLEALHTVSSRQMAKDILLDEYYKTFDSPDDIPEADYEEMPY